MLSLPVELTRRGVLDGDLDVFVDLGEAVAQGPTPTPRSNSRSTSPIRPDSLSLTGSRGDVHPSARVTTVGGRVFRSMNVSSACAP